MELPKIEKKDWLELKKSAEMNLKQSMISTAQFSTLIQLCLERLAEFGPEVKEEVEDEVEIRQILDDAQKNN